MTDISSDGDGDLLVAPPLPDPGLVSLATTNDDIAPKPPLDEELGVSMSMPFSVPSVVSGIGGGSSATAAQQLLRRSDISVKQLVEMRQKDGQARALYRLMVLPIRAALRQCTFTPADGGETEAEFIEKMLMLPPNSGGMTTMFTRVIAQLLMAIFDGFSAFELVYWVPVRGELKGKVTLKKIAYRPSDTVFFKVDKHGGFDGFFQRCFAGDTEVSLLDGTTWRIDELAARLDEFWVYSSSKDGRVVPGKATARKVSDSEPLLEVELDNGHRVRCTLTHPWRLLDGSYKRASGLVSGDRLLPLYRRLVKLSGSGREYEQVWHPIEQRWEWTHSAVFSDQQGQIRGGEVVHHRDVNRFNNAPSNLQRVTRKEHADLHSRMGQIGIKAAHAWWETEEGRARRAELSSVPWGAQLRPEGYAPEMKRRWESGVYDAKAVWEHPSGEAAYHRRREITVVDVERVFAELRESGSPRGARDVAAVLGCSWDTVQARVREAGHGSWALYRKARGDERLTVSGNHSVVAVRSVAPEAVYDIEVDDHHNFALAAGIFVHNTIFQGDPIDVTIDKENAFYYAANEEENPFYGVSYFSAAFYHYDKKVKLYYLAHLAAQHRAVGTRVGKIPKGADTREKAAFKKALTDFGLAQAMLVPDGYSVEELGKSTAVFDFVALINHHDHAMSKSVLAPFFDKDATGGALVDFSTQQDDMFLLMERAIMDEIAAAINTYLTPKFIDWNFGTGKYPLFQWGPFTDEQKAAIRSTFEKLAIAGTTNVTDEFMLELEKLMADELGLEIDYDEVEAQLEVQKKLDDELKAEQAKAGIEVAKNPPEPKIVAAPGIKPAATAPAKRPTPAGKPVKATHVGPLLSLSDLAQAVLEDLRGETDD